MTTQTFSSKSSCCLQQHWWAMQLQLSTLCRVTAKRTHTHTHFSWGEHTTNSHTQSCLQSPKASNSKKIAQPAAILLPLDASLTEKQRARARTHTHIHARDAKSKALLLIHASAQNACRCQNALLGRFFFLCLTVKPWVCTHPCCKTGRGIFRDELLAQAPKKNLYCFELIWKRELIFGRQGGGGDDGQLSNLGSAICNKDALCSFRFSFEEQFWWFFHPPRDRVTEGKREALRGLGYTLETNWCFLSTGHSSLLPVWWEMKRREGMRTFMWFTDICHVWLDSLITTMLSRVCSSCRLVNFYWLGNKTIAQYKRGFDGKYRLKQISLLQFQPGPLFHCVVDILCVASFLAPHV